MDTTRLSTKGQVILPKAVRASRGWPPGTEFSVENTPEGVLLRPLGRFPPSRLEEVAGSLKWQGKPKSLRQMKRGVIHELKARHDRGRY